MAGLMLRNGRGNPSEIRVETLSLLEALHKPGLIYY